MIKEKQDSVVRSAQEAALGWVVRKACEGRHVSQSLRVIKEHAGERSLV